MHRNKFLFSLLGIAYSHLRSTAPPQDRVSECNKNMTDMNGNKFLLCPTSWHCLHSDDMNYLLFPARHCLQAAKINCPQCKASWQEVFLWVRYRVPQKHDWLNQKQVDALRSVETNCHIADLTRRVILWGNINQSAIFAIFECKKCIGTSCAACTNCYYAGIGRTYVHPCICRSNQKMVVRNVVKQTWLNSWCATDGIWQLQSLLGSLDTPKFLADTRIDDVPFPFRVVRKCFLFLRTRVLINLRQLHKRNASRQRKAVHLLWPHAPADIWFANCSQDLGRSSIRISLDMIQ